MNISAALIYIFLLAYLIASFILLIRVSTKKKKSTRADVVFLILIAIFLLGLYFTIIWAIGQTDLSYVMMEGTDCNQIWTFHQHFFSQKACGAI